MNDEELKQFEEEARRVGRVSLAGEWREEILAAALGEDGGPRAAWWMPPKWMGAGLAAGWIAIGALNLNTPKTGDSSPPVVRDLPVERLMERRLLVASFWNGDTEGGR